MGLMVDPESSCANLRRLAADGQLGAVRLLRGDRLHAGAAAARAGERHRPLVHGRTTRGWRSSSLAYLLLDRPMQRRFASDPAFQATDLLLQERVPQDAVASIPHPAEVSAARGTPAEAEANYRVFTTPHTPAPEVHLLSNGRYHVVVTAAGGGYSRWRDLAVTRWHEDPTRDCWGTFCYLRDVETGEFWSTAHQPTLKQADELRGDLLAGPGRVPPPRRRHRDARRDQRLARGRHRAAPHQRHQPRQGRRGRSS